MAYKITEDSCLDLTEDMRKDPGFQIIPPTLQVGDTQVVDDETFDQKRFIEMVKACPEYPKTACPSLETFKVVFEEAKAGAVFVIALSSRPNGSYSSVAAAKKLYGGEMTEKGMVEQAKKVVAIDSFSVSSGELDIVPFVRSLRDSGLEFDEVVEKTLAYGGDMNTYFMLENLDTPRKNGRPSGLQASLATALNAKPVTGAGTGTIIKLDQARGASKVLQRMYDIVVKGVADAISKIVVVCHVNSPERAKYIKDELAKRVGSKKIVVTNAAGMVTVYANDGGIILAVWYPPGEVLWRE